MQVCMHNLLSSLLSDIELESISGYIHLMSQITSQKKQSADHSPVLINHI